MSQIKETKKIPPREEMPVIMADIRINTFDEVALGFSEEQALVEASRCLQCKKPKCMESCPVNVDIPGFINLIKQKEYQKAVDKIREKNCLPGICGRVCPQEDLCEGACIQGKKNQPVAIGALQRFVADWELNNGKGGPSIPGIKPTGKKVAVIGSGPAGLATANDLALMGYQVTIMEALHIAGGVMVYGIPEYRLPNTIIQQEIDYIKKLGVELKTNMVVGKTDSVNELLRDYDAVFVGAGAGLPWFMEIPGETLNGVYSSNEFLMRVNLMNGYRPDNDVAPIHIGERVAIIGGGNVAMDCARTALRLGGKETNIIYRRSEVEMPACKEELTQALEEGVRFTWLTSPIEVRGDENGWVKSIICRRYELGEPDASGRRRPIAIPGSEHEIEIDTVVMAIGQGANMLFANDLPDLETSKNGNIAVEETTGQTSKPGIFAGGDIVTGAATVVQAINGGRKAARAINDYLMGCEETN